MKKAKQIITHPLFIILLFCGILISGEQMGGIYLFYIFLGLPHWVFHSVTGIIGIGCLLFSLFAGKAKAPFTNIAGALCMIASLVYFFIQPNGSYNYGTFVQFLPLSILIIFNISLIVFIITNSKALFQKLNNTNGHFIV